MTNIVYNKNGVPFDIDSIATDLNGKLDVDITNASATGQNNIATLSTPSSSYTNLTLGTSGASYTADKTGYVFLRGQSSVADGYIALTQGNLTCSNRSMEKYVVDVVMPIAKGKTFNAYYDGTLSNVTFRLVWAEGALGG